MCTFFFIWLSLHFNHYAAVNYKNFVIYSPEKVRQQQNLEASYEQDLHQPLDAEQIYQDIAADNRCDLECHRACRHCGSSLSKWAAEAFCIQRINDDNVFKWLLLPCW